jgi:hypothetical protein
MTSQQSGEQSDVCTVFYILLNVYAFVRVMNVLPLNKISLQISIIRWAFTIDFDEAEH